MKKAGFSLGLALIALVVQTAAFPAWREMQPVDLSCSALTGPESQCADPFLIGLFHAYLSESGPAGSCTASFLYTYLEGNTVVFYNNSAGASGYEWDFGEGVIEAENGLSVRVGFPADTATVCLTVWNETGCSDTYCLFIHSGAEEELCQQTDCVWPGDADGDGKANHYDLLNIGLGYGSEGPQRPFYPYPDDPIAWAPNYSDDWADWIGPVNFKHLDCNGDGQVDDSDVDAIPYNYTPDVDLVSDPVPGAPPVYFQFEAGSIIINDDTPDFFEITVDLMVGNSLLPMLDLYGMAIQVAYPYDLAVPNTVTADYDDNSFLGNVDDILNVQEDLYAYDLGRFDLAFSRKDGAGRNGYGKVASLTFVVSHDIIDGRAAPDTPFSLTLRGVKLVDSQGQPLGFDFPADTATLTIINDTVAGADTGSPVSADELRIFPNPAGDWLDIRAGAGMTGQPLEVFNVRGESVLRRVLDHGSLRLDLSGLAPGVYWLRVTTAKGVVSRKLAVN